MRYFFTLCSACLYLLFLFVAPRSCTILYPSDFNFSFVCRPSFLCLFLALYFLLFCFISLFYFIIACPYCCCLPVFSVRSSRYLFCSSRLITSFCSRFYSLLFTYVFSTLYLSSIFFSLYRLSFPPQFFLLCSSFLGLLCIISSVYGSFFFSFSSQMPFSSLRQFLPLAYFWLLPAAFSLSPRIPYFFSLFFLLPSLYCFVLLAFRYSILTCLLLLCLILFCHDCFTFSISARISHLNLFYPSSFHLHSFAFLIILTLVFTYNFLLSSSSLLPQLRCSFLLSCTFYYLTFFAAVYFSLASSYLIICISLFSVCLGRFFTIVILFLAVIFFFLLYRLALSHFLCLVLLFSPYCFLIFLHFLINFFCFLSFYTS